MKKLFLLVMFIINVSANDCKDYYNKAKIYMIRSEKVFTAAAGIYYAIQASNYLKLFELCWKYNIK